MSERDDASYIEHLQAKIKELEQEIDRLRKEKGLSSARDGLTFNPRTGTHIEASTNKHFCTACIADDKRWELKVEPHGWKCMICRKYYTDPDNPPRVVGSRYGGGGSWMG